MNFLSLISLFIFVTNLWATSPGPIFSYKELSQIVGYEDVWKAYESQRISYDEVMALSSYVSYDDPIYPEINEYLRTGKADLLYYFTNVDELKISISQMDSGIKKLAILPANLLSFRGVNFKFRNDKCYKKGEIFNDPGFGSTSVNHSVAESFSGAIADNIKSSGVLYLYSNDRHPGILINSLEEEVLLPRNLKFKIMDRVDQGKVCRLLVQICVTECTNEVSRLEVTQNWKKIFQK